MAKVRCESVSSGLRNSEAAVSIRDYRNRRHFIRVERDYLSVVDGASFLPVGVVHVDPKTRAVLVELPHEAETGANRLWIDQEQLDEPIETFA
jgi:hypothetical protein